jgi:glyoxylase-like metal-dependent hydrolase (beta-lactamase superfamily II)
MSFIKSFSVGNGDMFHIEHNSDNFTIIDCCLDPDRPSTILDEISRIGAAKGITRFISTHPDDDHIRGLDVVNKEVVH